MQYLLPEALWRTHLQNKTKQKPTWVTESRESPQVHHGLGQRECMSLSTVGRGAGLRRLPVNGVTLHDDWRLGRRCGPNHNNYHNNNDNQITRVAHEYQYTPNLLPLVKVSLGVLCSYSNSFCRLMALDGVHWYWYWYGLMLGAWSTHQPLRTASEIDTHSTYSTHSTHRVAQGEDVW